MSASTSAEDWQSRSEEEVMNGEWLSLPSSSPPAGLWFAVARWSMPEDDTGYLLELYLDPDPDLGSLVKYDIHVLRRTEGRWSWSSAGGADWRFGTASPPMNNEFWLDSSGVGDPDGNGIFVVPGFAGSQVKSVMVSGMDWRTISPVEPKTGAFLVGAQSDELITMTALDHDDRPIGSKSHRTLWEVAHTGGPAPKNLVQWAG